MAKTIVYRSIFNLTILLLCSCSNGGKIAHFQEDADTVVFHYAKHLRLVKQKDCTVAEIRNPWDTTKVLDTYILVPEGQPLPKTDAKGTVVRTPLRKSVIYTAVHSSLAVQLGAGAAIRGVCDVQYINTPFVRQGCTAGSIADLGNSMNPNVEKMMDLRPDAILVSPFENSGGYGRVGQLGIPIIECADYMEPSPLGRAEWVKFYGLLFGKEVQADTLFASVEKNYNELKKMAEQARTRPQVFCGLMDGGTWYIPGGRSTTGILYADANAAYVFADNKQSGSVPLNFEAVYDRAADTPLWFINYNQPTAMTYPQLLQLNPRYAQFRAYREHRVFGCNTGTSAYYENYPFHPDRLLRDMVAILHPELLPGEKTVYYVPLKGN